ncbi:MAG: hypothetical protein RL701_7707 [Pseudomonadota bacterium]
MVLHAAREYSVLRAGTVPTFAFVSSRRQRPNQKRMERAPNQSAGGEQERFSHQVDERTARSCLPQRQQQTRGASPSDSRQFCVLLRLCG